MKPFSYSMGPFVFTRGAITRPSTFIEEKAAVLGPLQLAPFVDLKDFACDARKALGQVLASDLPQ